MYITPDIRKEYRTALITYYFNLVEIKTQDTMSQVRRQVESMEDKVLISNYNRIFGI